MLVLIHTLTVSPEWLLFESVAVCLSVQVSLHIWVLSCRCWPHAWLRISVKGVWWLRTGASSWWTRSWAAWSSLRCTAGRRRLPTTSKVRQHSNTDSNRKRAFNDGDWAFTNQRIISVALHCIQRNTFPNPLSFLSPPSLKWAAEKKQLTLFLHNALGRFDCWMLNKNNLCDVDLYQWFSNHSSAPFACLPNWHTWFRSSAR